MESLYTASFRLIYQRASQEAEDVLGLTNSTILFPKPVHFLESLGQIDLNAT